MMRDFYRFSYSRGSFQDRVTKPAQDNSRIGRHSPSRSEAAVVVTTAVTPDEVSGSGDGDVTARSTDTAVSSVVTGPALVEV